MRLISQSQLNLMRQLNEDNLPHRAILEREGSVRQAGGEYSSSGWSQVVIMPCRLQPVVKSYRTITEEIRAGQMDNFGYWMVITQHDFDSPVPATDRFRIQALRPDGSVEWEKLLAILGSTGPHTAESMRKFVCRDFIS